VEPRPAARACFATRCLSGRSRPISKLTDTGGKPAEDSKDTERLRFVAENHGITLAQMRRDIDRAMQEQRRRGREIPFQVKKSD
jgi:hypothetical protein